MIGNNNFRHNCECFRQDDAGKMINGQALGVVSKMRYGLCRMSFNGCEVIAVYNALIYADAARPLPEIAVYMEKFRMLMGVFGCSPYKIGRALRHFGANQERVRSAENAEAFIVTFWTKIPFLSSLHTVFCVRKNNGIIVYNRYNNCGEPQLCRNIEEVTGKHRPVTIYTIYRNKNKDIPGE